MSLIIVQTILGLCAGAGVGTAIRLYSKNRRLMEQLETVQQKNEDKIAADQELPLLSAEDLGQMTVSDFDVLESAVAAERKVRNAANADGTTADHEHVWTSGMLPGNKRIRVCTVAGCGKTEDA